MCVGKRTFAAPRTTPPPPSSPPGDPGRRARTERHAAWETWSDFPAAAPGDGPRSDSVFLVKGGVSAVPGQGPKISHATTHGQNKKTREHKTL